MTSQRTATVGVMALLCMACLASPRGVAIATQPAHSTEPARPASAPAKPALSKEPPKAPATLSLSTPAKKPEPNDKPDANDTVAPVKQTVDGEAADAAAPNAEQALTLLKEGNARWTGGAPINPNTSSQRRALLAEQGQKPFVTVLTCADSRLPVERLFDRGVGDVFVVRVAGNISGDSETGTIEYGLGHLKTPLLVVMGHSKCGAVAAAVSGAELHGKVAQLVANIQPAVERARRNNPGADARELAIAAVKENVWQSVFDLLKTSTEVREMVKTGKVRVVGAVCDVATGKVEFMGEHPWQAELMSALEAKESARHVDANAEPAEHK